MYKSFKRLDPVPVPSINFIREAHWSWHESEKSIVFTYERNDQAHRGGFAFAQVIATQTRAERCCTEWHLDNGCDALVEVFDSKWKIEILASMNEFWRHKYEVHHYLICLDSVGCFEVLAASWSSFSSIVPSIAKV
jgi:hypothetical protein